MKSKAIIPLVLGLAVGLLAVKFVIDTIRKAQSNSQAAPTFKVVRARQNIGAYEKFAESMLEVIESNDENLAPAKDRFESIEDLLERVSAISIPMHVPILETMLAPKGTSEGMVGRIPPGFRAVSVRIDEITGVAYQIKPGDWVDVTVVMDIDSSSRRRETISEVVLQRVEVAAIGRGSQSEQETGNAKGKAAKSATLFVREQDVPRLHLASSRGKITLSMRGKDNQSGEPASARLSTLFDKMDGKRKSKLNKMWVEPEEPFEVVIYRGSADPQIGVEAERVFFQNRYSSNIVKVTRGSSARSSKRSINQSGPSRKPGKANKPQSIGSVVKFNENADNKRSKIGANNTGGGM